MAAFHGFNQWLLDDWGFDYRGRIFAAPMIALADVETAAKEVDWCIEHGARLVCMVPGPVPLAQGGSISPGWPLFDPVWERLDAAGITVGIHGGDSGMNAYVSRWEPTGDFEAFRTTAFKMVSTHLKTIFDTMAALICHGVFDRHPNLRVATIENGGMYVPHLLDELSLAYRKAPQDFGRDPVEAFREHVWVSPFYEDDISLLKDLIGADHLLFGSDWPHAEGLAEPTSFIDDIPGFTPDEVRLIMHDNASALVTPRR